MSPVVHFSLITILLFSFCSARPPGRDEHDHKLTAGGGDQTESVEYLDYLEDFIPVLLNSTKLHENYHLEKKKYLTSVLGFPAKMRKMS